MSPTQPSPRGGTLASDTTSPGDKAAELRRKAEAAARDPEDWVKENRRRAAGSFVIGKTETESETERQRDRESKTRANGVPPMRTHARAHLMMKLCSYA